MVGFDSESLRAVAYRQQVVFGTNYVVKYSATRDGEEFNFLARIYEPFAFTGETTKVQEVQTFGVTENSAIPTQILPDLIIDPPITIEPPIFVDPIPLDGG